MKKSNKEWKHQEVLALELRVIDAELVFCRRLEGKLEARRQEVEKRLGVPRKQRATNNKGPKEQRPTAASYQEMVTQALCSARGRVFSPPDVVEALHLEKRYTGVIAAALIRAAKDGQLIQGEGKLKGVEGGKGRFYFAPAAPLHAEAPKPTEEALKEGEPQTH